MSKVGGRRNFGYGKRMEYAGKQALRDRYGNGHHGTTAGHAERWQRFVAWCRDECEIRDARLVDRNVVHSYGHSLASRVAADKLAVSYAQNLLSTVNVVLETMRGDRQVRVAPAALVGQRSQARTNPPTGLDQNVVHGCTNQLRQNGHERIAAVVEVARALGLRLREASLLDARAALNQAEKYKAINITAGTKGGRGHRVDRWVPISRSGVTSLTRAVLVQGECRNLLPTDLSWKQWNSYVHHVWSTVRHDHGLKTIHDLRAAYACERYQQLTGVPAPVVAGKRQADRETDQSVRETIALELGHATH